MPVPTIKIAALLATTLMISACDVAYPVAVIGEDGTMFRGSATNTFLAGGQFHATSGKVSCTGTYTKQIDLHEVSFPVRCSNGMRGIGTATFQTDTRGAGDVLMTDGSRWQFLFGRDAAGI